MIFKRKKKVKKVEIDKPRKSTYAQSDSKINYENPWKEKIKVDEIKDKW